MKTCLLGISRIAVLWIFCAATDLCAQSPATASQPPARTSVNWFAPVRPARPIQIIAAADPRILAGWSVAVPDGTRQALDMLVDDSIPWWRLGLEAMPDGTSGQISWKIHSTLFEVAPATAQRHGTDPAAFSPRFPSAKLLTLPELLALARGRINLMFRLHGPITAANLHALADLVENAQMTEQVLVWKQPDAVEPPSKLRCALSAPAGDAIALRHWLDGLDISVSAILLTPNQFSPVVRDDCRERKITPIVRLDADPARDDQPEHWDALIAQGATWFLSPNAPALQAHNIRQRLNAWQAKGGPKLPLVSLHRGANRYAPENTVPALTFAAAMHADYVEIDIRTSQDGVLFLMHDGNGLRTARTPDPVKALTAASVSQWDAGSWFSRAFARTTPPRGSDVVRIAQQFPQLHWYLDAKELTPAALVNLAKDAGILEKSVVYQSPAYLKQLRTLEPRLKRLPALSRIDLMEELINTVEPYGFDAKWSLLSEDFVKRCHARGVQVFSDALGLYERTSEYHKAARIGVDLIQTDYPLRVLRAWELLLEAADHP